MVILWDLRAQGNDWEKYNTIYLSIYLFIYLSIHTGIYYIPTYLYPLIPPSLIFAAPWHVLQKGWKETNCVTFSPDGSQFATGNDLCELHLWNMSNIKVSNNVGYL